MQLINDAAREAVNILLTERTPEQSTNSTSSTPNSTSTTFAAPCTPSNASPNVRLTELPKLFPVFRRSNFQSPSTSRWKPYKIKDT